MRQLILKFVKFGLVGSLGTVIDFSITALCIFVFGYKEYIFESIEKITSSGLASDSVIIFILLANLIGFVTAASTNFLLNRIWTWKSTDPKIKSQYFKFLIVSVGGLIINLFIIYVCNIFLNIEFEIFGILINRFWIAKIIATAVVMLWNFIVNNIYTFRM